MMTNTIDEIRNIYNEYINSYESASLRQLAKEVGVNPGILSDLIKGKRTLSPSVFFKFRNYAEGKWDSHRLTRFERQFSQERKNNKILKEFYNYLHLKRDEFKDQCSEAIDQIVERECEREFKQFLEKSFIVNIEPIYKEEVHLVLNSLWVGLEQFIADKYGSKDSKLMIKMDFLSSFSEV